MSAKHYIRADKSFAGTVIDGPAPEGAVADVPVAPTDGRQAWIDDAWQWPLDLAKVERISAVDARFEAALVAGMSYGGKVLQIREQDQANLTTMGNEARWAKALNAPWPADFAWRMADDSFFALSTADAMIAMGEAAKAEVYRLRLVKWSHTDAIRALESAAAVAAYDVETGW